MRKDNRTLMSYAPDIRVMDCTLRDGGLTNDFHFTDEFVRDLYLANLKAGVDYMEFGYKASKELFDVKKFGKWKFCDDKDIRDAKPNDIAGFLTEHPTINVIAINGFGKYRKFGEKIKRSLAGNSGLADIRVLRLPETSGGNANYGWGILENMAGEWKQIFD